jgi:hypothetical protein
MLRPAISWLDARRSGPRAWVGLVAVIWVLGSLGILVGVPQLLQWLLVLPVFPLMLLDLRAEQPGRAVVRMGVWAAALAGLTLVWSLTAPDWLGRAVPEAGFAAWETGRFVEGGRGLLARPSDYLTDHALDYLYVTAGSAFGAGLVPLWMGAARVMAVAHVWGSAIAGGAPAGLSLGLQPWSPVGALGYALLVVGWAEVTVAYLARRSIRWSPLGRRVLLATSLLAIHASLKLALAGPWREWLSP